MAMIFQDPLSSLHPYYTIGAQIIEAYRIHNDVTQAGGPPARHRPARPGRHPAARDPDGRLPAPVFRRHAAAGDDRDGALCDPELLIADEPTTALDVTVQAQILDLINELQRNSAPRSSSSPTISAWSRAGRRRPRHVRGPGGRVRGGGGHLRPPGPPLHLGAAGLDAADGPGTDPADPDPRYPTQSDQGPLGLPVPPAVPLYPPDRRTVRHRGAAAARDGDAGTRGRIQGEGRR